MNIAYLQDWDAIVKRQKLPPIETKSCTAEAWIDQVSQTGLVQGWAREIDQVRPLRLQLWLDGEEVGGATAACFRSDLLLAGIGHGHYGYRCQLRPGVALQGKLQLREPGSSRVLAEMPLVAGDRGVAAWDSAQTVDSLLSSLVRWSMADVGNAIGALELEAHLSRWGSRRFIAMVGKFLLDRWPEATDYGQFQHDLDQGAISADACFGAVLDSTERRNNGLAPVSPYDGRFPFGLCGARGAAAKPASIVSSVAPQSEYDTDLLVSAILISAPWNNPCAQLLYDEARARLLCHPAATGAAVARIETSVMRGPIRARVRVSVDHARSQPIEFAFVVGRGREGDAELLMRFQAECDGLLRWSRVSYGDHHLLEADSDVDTGPVRLYFGTRMACGASNDFAWAHFSELVIVSEASISYGVETGPSVRSAMIRLV